MRPSDVKGFYYITHQDNLASIFRLGILSHNRAKNVKHIPIDSPEVNARRDFGLPSGRNLHDYANLFFNCRNAMMMAKVKGEGGPGVNNLAVVVVDRSIAVQIEGVLASDRNASKTFVLIQPYRSILPHLKKYMVFSRDWRDKDWRVQNEKKAMAMAEVLVPNCVPTQFIVAILVGTNWARKNLLDRLPDCSVPVNIKWDDFWQPSAGARVPEKHKS